MAIQLDLTNKNKLAEGDQGIDPPDSLINSSFSPDEGIKDSYEPPSERLVTQTFPQAPRLPITALSKERSMAVFSAQTGGDPLPTIGDLPINQQYIEELQDSIEDELTLKIPLAKYLLAAMIQLYPDKAQGDYNRIVEAYSSLSQLPLNAAKASTMIYGLLTDWEKHEGIIGDLGSLRGNLVNDVRQTNSAVDQALQNYIRDAAPKIDKPSSPPAATKVNKEEDVKPVDPAKELDDLVKALPTMEHAKQVETVAGIVQRFNEAPTTSTTGLTKSAFVDALLQVLNMSFKGDVDLQGVYICLFRLLNVQSSPIRQQVRVALLSHSFDSYKLLSFLQYLVKCLADESRLIREFSLEFNKDTREVFMHLVNQLSAQDTLAILRSSQLLHARDLDHNDNAFIFYVNLRLLLAQKILADPTVNVNDEFRHLWTYVNKGSTSSRAENVKEILKRLYERLPDAEKFHGLLNLCLKKDDDHLVDNKNKLLEDILTSFNAQEWIALLNVSEMGPGFISSAELVLFLFHHYPHHVTPDLWTPIESIFVEKVSESIVGFSVDSKNRLLALLSRLNETQRANMINQVFNVLEGSTSLNTQSKFFLLCLASFRLDLQQASIEHSGFSVFDIIEQLGKSSFVRKLGPIDRFVRNVITQKIAGMDQTQRDGLAENIYSYWYRLDFNDDGVSLFFLNQLLQTMGHDSQTQFLDFIFSFMEDLVKIPIMKRALAILTDMTPFLKDAALLKLSLELFEGEIIDLRMIHEQDIRKPIVDLQNKIFEQRISELSEENWDKLKGKVESASDANFSFTLRRLVHFSLADPSLAQKTYQYIKSLDYKSEFRNHADVIGASLYRIIKGVKNPDVINEIVDFIISFNAYFKSMRVLYIVKPIPDLLSLIQHSDPAVFNAGFKILEQLVGFHNDDFNKALATQFLKQAHYPIDRLREVNIFLIQHDLPFKLFIGLAKFYDTENDIYMNLQKALSLEKLGKFGISLQADIDELFSKLSGSTQQSLARRLIEGMNHEDPNTLSSFRSLQFVLHYLPVADQIRYLDRFFRMLYSKSAHADLIPKIKHVAGALGQQTHLQLTVKEFIIYATSREGRNDFRQKSVREMNEDELDGFARANQISDFIAIFKDDPTALIEAITALKGDTIGGQRVEDFVKRYVGLKVRRTPVGDASEEPQRRPTTEDYGQKRRAYIAGLVRLMEAEQRADFPDGLFKRQTQLLIRLSRKSFQHNANELITELRAQATNFESDASITNPNFKKFLVDLHNQVAAYFEGIVNFEIQYMRTRAFGYQQEGVHFLVNHNAAILADEAGMGKSFQAIAAVETQPQDIKKVLWVTPATNKQNIANEIKEHSFVTEDQILILASGDPSLRSQQISDLVEGDYKYVVTNYESLVSLQKHDPDSYNKLNDFFDLIITDEAQMIDNEKTKRNQALTELKSPRRWLLTASPYQSKPETFYALLHYLDPEGFSDEKAFRERYCKTVGGLKLLHDLLSEYMLRRTKTSTFAYFESPDQTSYAGQLSDGVPRLPTQVNEPDLNYELTDEQSHLIAWMIADFNGWAEDFNNNLPENAEPVNMTRISSFLKYHYIFKVMYDPEYFGLDPNMAMLEALNREVDAKIAAGQNMILWAWNVDMIKRLKAHYEARGMEVLCIYGEVAIEDRQGIVEQFQAQDGTPRILIANYDAAGQGLTLTNAHADIFVQLPDRYPTEYQAQGRKQRVIGLRNIRYAKHLVTTKRLVPVYSKAFIGSLALEGQSELAGVLAHGTLAEQRSQRLDGARKIFELVMEGYATEAELESYLNAGYVAAMSGNEATRLKAARIHKESMTSTNMAMTHLTTLTDLLGQRADSTETIAQLVDVFSSHPSIAKQVGEVIKRHESALKDKFKDDSGFYKDDMEFILSLFSIKNTYMRHQIFKRLPRLMGDCYSQGLSMTAVSRSLDFDRLTPVSFIAQLFKSSGDQAPHLIFKIVNELSASRQQMDQAQYHALEDRFFMGVFGIYQSSGGLLLLNKGSLFDEAGSLEEKIRVLYQIGLLYRLNYRGLKELSQASFDSWPVFQKGIQTATWEALAYYFESSADQISPFLEDNPQWQNNLDHLLALIAGWEDHSDVNQDVLDQFGEVMENVLNDTYVDFRYGDSELESGERIRYRAGDKDFWEVFAVDHQSTFLGSKLVADLPNTSLVNAYRMVQMSYDSGQWKAEGVWVQNKLHDFKELPLQGKEGVLQELQNDRRALGQVLMGDLDDQAKSDILKKYDMSDSQDVAQKRMIQKKLGELKSLIGWMNLEIDFGKQVQGDSLDENLVIPILKQKISFYRSHRFEILANQMQTLLDMMVRREGVAKAFPSKVVVQDTDDPAILTRMGQLHPELFNSMNANGNPEFTRFIPVMMGSKNMKLLIVRDEHGEILAVARVKVKRLEDNSSVYYLERGMSRREYDFEKEMLAHLYNKAKEYEKRTGTKISVMTDAGKEIKGQMVSVYGTGAYASDEYVGTLFGWRRAGFVRHFGTLVDEPELSNEPESFEINDSKQMRKEAAVLKLAAQNVGSPEGLGSQVARSDSQGGGGGGGAVASLDMENGRFPTDHYLDFSGVGPSSPFGMAGGVERGPEINGWAAVGAYGNTPVRRGAVPAPDAVGAGRVQGDVGAPLAAPEETIPPNPPFSKGGIAHNAQRMAHGAQRSANRDLSLLRQSIRAAAEELRQMEARGELEGNEASNMGSLKDALELLGDPRRGTTFLERLKPKFMEINRDDLLAVLMLVANHHCGFELVVGAQQAAPLRGSNDAWAPYERGVGTPAAARALPPVRVPGR